MKRKHKLIYIDELDWINFRNSFIKITRIYNHVSFSNIRPAWNMAEHFSLSLSPFALRIFFTNSSFFVNVSLSMFWKGRKKKKTSFV